MSSPTVTVSYSGLVSDFELGIVVDGNRVSAGDAFAAETSITPSRSPLPGLVAQGVRRKLSNFCCRHRPGFGGEPEVTWLVGRESVPHASKAPQT
jgi:hypothetical protein